MIHNHEVAGSIPAPATKLPERAFFMYYIYIIYSQLKDKYYTGFTENISTRLEKHNAGATPSTKTGRPWTLAYKEKFENKTDAIKRENQIKKMKSRIFIETLIKAQNR